MTSIIDLAQPRSASWFRWTSIGATLAGTGWGLFSGLAERMPTAETLALAAAGGCLFGATSATVALWGDSFVRGNWWAYHTKALAAVEPPPVEQEPEQPGRDWPMPPGMRLDNGVAVLNIDRRKPKGQQYTQVVEHIGLVQVDDKTQGATFRMNVNKAVWLFARNLDAAEGQTTEAVWEKLKVFQSIYYFRAVREWMIAQGIGEWKNPEVPRSGWKITRQGRPVINYLRECARCPLPERWEGYSASELR